MSTAKATGRLIAVPPWSAPAKARYAKPKTEIASIGSVLHGDVLDMKVNHGKIWMIDEFSITHDHGGG